MPIPLPPGISPAGPAQTFEDCLARTNPTKASLKQFADQIDDTPFIMLNLLRFRPRGNPSIYLEYAKAAKPEVEKLDSHIGLWGMTLNDLSDELVFDTSWDAIVLPVYGRRASYLSLQQEKNYQLAIPFRVAGTERRMMYALKDNANLTYSGKRAEEIYNGKNPILSEENVHFTIELLKFKTKPEMKILSKYIESLQNQLANMGGNLAMVLSTEVPILSDSVWDLALIIEFKNKEELIAFHGSHPTSQLKSKLYLEQTLKIAAQSLKLAI